MSYMAIRALELDLDRVKRNALSHLTPTAREVLGRSAMQWTKDLVSSEPERRRQAVTFLAEKVFSHSKTA